MLSPPLLKYVCMEILVILRILENANIMVNVIKPKHLFISKDFKLKLDYQKKARATSDFPRDDRMFYHGLTVLKLVGRKAIEGLIALTARTLREEFFVETNANKDPVMDLGVIFECEPSLLRLTPAFLSQNCCFLHFLLGQRRVLIKSSSAEQLIEKNKQIFSEIRRYRLFIKNLLSAHDDLENYLCFCTRFDAEERLSLSQAINHHFLSAFHSEDFLKSHARLLDSYFGIFVDKERENVPQFYAHSIFKSLGEFLKTKPRWFKLKDPFNSPRQTDSLALSADSPAIGFLGYELGAKPESVMAALEQAVSGKSPSQ